MLIDLSLLTEEEAALFETLMGKLNFEKPKKKFAGKPYTFTHKTTLKPYVLQIYYDCSTCGSVTSEIFEMVPAADGTGLVSRKSNNNGTPDRSTRRNCNLCSHCRAYLQSLEKEDLISRLITALVRI